MKKILFFVIVCQLTSFLFAEQPLSGWGYWEDIDNYTSYRVRCVRFNESSGKYIWDVEVQNQSNRDLSISIAVTDGEEPSSLKYGRHTIESGDSYIFELNFAYAGPDESIYVWWNHLVYE